MFHFHPREGSGQWQLNQSSIFCLKPQHLEAFLSFPFIFPFLGHLKYSALSGLGCFCSLPIPTVLYCQNHGCRLVVQLFVCHSFQLETIHKITNVESLFFFALICLCFVFLPGQILQQRILCWSWRNQHKRDESSWSGFFIWSRLPVECDTSHIPPLLLLPSERNVDSVSSANSRHSSKYRKTTENPLLFQWRWIHSSKTACCLDNI